MFNRIVKALGFDANDKRIKEFAKTADIINELEPQYEALSNEQLRAKTAEYKSRVQAGESLDDILPEAFAVVREASKRTIGLRHYDIQLVGGITIHKGIIAEMRTGEGKTLVSTMPIYLNALEGKGVHLVTVNDYLARRDARWMAPIFDFLGMSIGVLQMAARTEHGKKAFIVNFEKESPHEDQHQLEMVPRKLAYAADITYGTTSEFGFDYLRDNMARRLSDRVQRSKEEGGHRYAIIDEVDNVLIDEARTPLIISGPSYDDAENYQQMANLVKQLNAEDYDVDERARSIALTEIGEIHVEQILGEPLRDPERPEDITPEQAQKLGFLEQSLRAQFVFKRNKDYLVQGGKVVIVDENTGRLMPGRRWSDGLHQAIEAKEGVQVQPENVTYATITIQNYYRMYEKLSGMTGTAETESEEFHKIYQLDVLPITTNLDYQADHQRYNLLSNMAEDDEGYKYTYYVPKDNPDIKPTLFKRKDYPDVIYRTEEAKYRAIGSEILRYHTMGRPILLGTTSVELSEVISGRMKAEQMRRLAQTLILRDAWFEKNKKEEDGREVEELKFLNRPLNLLPPATMRKMAKDLGLNINPLNSDNVKRLCSVLYIPVEYSDRLAEVLKGGVPHQVLNARKHTEESQIIMGAGAYGAVTVATNMAGRGVDIKLGGEISEEVIQIVNRILKRNGYDDPYGFTLEEQEMALKKIDPENYGIYDFEATTFLKHIEEARLVKKLGGLHVIGSERHDSRRIDNQLRGRAGRQGDPGSSRFYLSMQDQLMRLFGGQQAEGLMERLKVDEAMPIEMGMVSKIVEQSQTRVEGANFDTRKHLLEYDDVLNNQREIIYSQRDRIFTKDDLSDDVEEMLQAEVERRVPEAMADEEGPWKLMAWLNQTQPPIQIGNVLFPTYAQRILMDHLDEQKIEDKEKAFDVMLTVAEDSLEAEEEHLISTINTLMDQAEESEKAQLKERLETVEIFFEGLGMELEDEDEDEDVQRRSPRDVEVELIGMVRVPLKMDHRDLRSDLDSAEQSAKDQVESYLFRQGIRRVLAAVERRLNESLGISITDIPFGDWDSFSETLLGKVDDIYDKRHRLFIGETREGLIAKDLKSAIAGIKGDITHSDLLNLLIRMPQGQRATFDRRTKRRVWRNTTRITYTHFVAGLLRQQNDKDLTKKILDHLKKARLALGQGWGFHEWNRLAMTPVRDLPKTSRLGLSRVIGADVVEAGRDLPVQKFSPDRVTEVIAELGRQTTTELYRQLLLSVISKLWIEYLTQMEALRVSIGLEAYGQRDPLVEYKKQASDLFVNLLAQIRIGVVTRMFTYRPQQREVLQAEKTAKPSTNGGEAPSTAEAVPVGGDNSSEGASGTGKRRRRRSRKKK